MLSIESQSILYNMVGLKAKNNTVKYSFLNISKFVFHFN